MSTDHREPRTSRSPQEVTDLRSPDRSRYPRERDRIRRGDTRKLSFSRRTRTRLSDSRCPVSPSRDHTRPRDRHEASISPHSEPRRSIRHPGDRCHRRRETLRSRRYPRGNDAYETSRKTRYRKYSSNSYDSRFLFDPWSGTSETSSSYRSGRRA